MTVLEVMERLGSKEETLIKSWIEDAVHLIQSNTKEKIEVSKRDLIKSSGSTDNVYILPADLVSLENISIKDTSDSKYKKIRRLSNQPHYLAEDISP
jgi:CTP:phosphocholine cytidylyltransferase-like protein